MTDTARSSRVPPQHILIATDFSLASERARDYALALAPRDCRVDVLHSTVLPVPWGAESPNWLPSEPCPRSRLLEKLARFAAPAEAPGREVKLMLEDGDPGDVILRAAARRHPDLVALGTHGRRGWDRRFNGSVASKVLRSCDAPVLTASSLCGMPAKRMRSVLCAVGRDAGAWRNVEFARALSEGCEADLTCVHVVDDMDMPGARLLPGSGTQHYEQAAERGRERLQAALLGGGASGAAAVLAFGLPTDRVIHAASNAEADLIVMGVQDGSPLRGGFFGTTAERVVRESFCPVLTLRKTSAAAARRAVAAWPLTALR
jgi:nucleotide-binding universal stress UspA family protein